MVTPSHHSRDTTTTQPRRSHEAAQSAQRKTAATPVARDRNV
ncbi:MAG TPA: hypothetical protein QF626_03060 [Prochlorococcaceae cyanobacterium Fu_MAG_50]|nr:hypothetical protein [Prochlorococcaceae cyanobacterium Fu_MAG_50]